MKTGSLKNEKIAENAPLMSRRSKLLSWSSLLFSLATLVFILSSVLASALFAQRTQPPVNVDPAYNGTTLFVPSRDVNSSTSFSSVDAARRNRPPEPAKTREDLFYPDGFLTLSSPTPEPNVDSSLGKTDRQSNDAQLRPLDPSVETTPLTVNPTQQAERKDSEKGRDHFTFFAVSIALAALGIFIYHEFRYRETLRSDLVRNARLCSPNATSSDFDSVLAADVNMTDPRAPSYVNPHYDADVLMFDDPDHHGKTLTDPDFDDFRFEVSDSQVAHSGPGLNEENFDFTPVGDSSVVISDEPVEDFVVGGGDLATLNDSQNSPPTVQH
ncbi:MAG: hypothetical protein ACOX0A_04380 [Thermoguttaceae bacterium]|jgi:hypothetical protein